MSSTKPYFLPLSNVIVDRKRIARIIKVTKMPDNSYIYDLFYLDNPSEDLKNVTHDRIILLPKTITNFKYKIFQPDELIVRNIDSRFYSIIKIRNTGGDDEIYSARRYGGFRIKGGPPAEIINISRIEFKSENQSDPR